MSAFDLEMASPISFPYQKLIAEGGLFEFDDLHNESERDGVLVKSRSWFRFKFRFRFRFRFRRVQIRIRRRFRLKVGGLRSCRVVLKKKLRVVGAVRLSCSKVLKRLKESRSHFGDLFAGNYMFLQVNPTSIKSIQKSRQLNNLNLHVLPSTHSLPTPSN